VLGVLPLSAVDVNVDGRLSIDLRSIRSKKTPGGIGAFVEAMLANLSASSLFSLPMCRSSQPSKLPSIMLYKSR
jgi:hypothetical protein